MNERIKKVGEHAKRAGEHARKHKKKTAAVGIILLVLSYWAEIYGVVCPLLPVNQNVCRVTGLAAGTVFELDNVTLDAGVLP